MSADLSGYRAPRRTVWIEPKNGMGHWASNFELRSMSRVERKLRLCAGSGWRGTRTDGYRWAQRLLGLCERWWLRGA